MMSQTTLYMHTNLTKNKIKYSIAFLAKQYTIPLVLGGLGGAGRLLHLQSSPTGWIQGGAGLPPPPDPPSPPQIWNEYIIDRHAFQQNKQAQHSTPVEIVHHSLGMRTLSFFTKMRLQNLISIDRNEYNIDRLAELKKKKMKEKQK